MRNVNLAAIHHIPWLEYRHALPNGDVCIRLRTAKDDFQQVSIRHFCSYRPNPLEHVETVYMEIAYRDDLFDYYEAVFSPSDPRVRYYFVLEADELTVSLDAAGLHHELPVNTEESFVFAYVYPPSPKPEWARGAVGYQIFPDRFRRSGEQTASLEPWDSTRYESAYRFGGNLRGIREAVPYLHELGVEIVYTTPIFDSDTAHHYNTFDYYRIDPLFGDENDLKALCDELHRYDMHLVLDGVFNHSGVGFAPFIDVKENGKASPYYDWFFMDDAWECGYQTFSFESYMPKLNLKNPDCADYFLKVGRYWLEKCGIDGWRLDVSPEVYPDFWREYHRMMLSVNPQSIMIAECWDDSREWVTVGDMFDGTMNYVLSRAIWQRIALQKGSVHAFDENINRCQMLYPNAVQEIMWNFLGSHDTERFRTRAGGKEELLRAASFFQLTMPGVPFIYYGDELGMEGANDPDCRRPMRWDNVEGNPMLSHYQRLIKLRGSSPALRFGVFRTLIAEENGLYAFERIDKAQKALVAINTSDHSLTSRITLPTGLQAAERLIDAVTGKKLFVSDGRISLDLAAGEGIIILW
ncbi:MAG: alpha amylase N-terminal ig-like domain-containing protein [Eubacteriales bacterium]|nr:alpha amylase N-terminal ig-like domain-containing protein [Eubacteriales bacterium]